MRGGAPGVRGEQSASGGDAAVAVAGSSAASAAITPAARMIKRRAMWVEWDFRSPLALLRCPPWDLTDHVHGIPHPARAYHPLSYLRGPGPG